ncbi:hypothetical protein BU24DRAFT_403080 [Aaosphaeria arxii CBS 175.79]|uniref:Zn(2)-C6 fungal-type domain-containing protein n=1 Tax=Aaosphaeria arxii CBS 175.79 TaxID=1450172 RepID=A0A6A5X6E2_9PLEO|nr:uncharacterized protein BU24DRAFT_403080 [Aaosphaeria arxii CBS 175.79]KAF2008470.1 hypothetical protein BU24DRAFT_403080 [Aaosphaeria arxii CBS 175.79]
MVGVPKSTGCLICRQRKIKCDENWPHCRNCYKNGKQCPGPPERHTFKSGLSGVKTSARDNESTRILNQSCNQLTQLNAKLSPDGGGMFQKWRMSSKTRNNNGVQKRTSKSPRSTISPSSSASPPQMTIARNPSPPQYMMLTRAFVEALNTGNVGHRMSAFGPFIREVPARIGHNAALDSAVVCLVNAHSSMVGNQGGCEIVNPGLYLHAVQTLQLCLEDPAQGMSSNTLCASVLLGIVEALAGPREGNRYLAHVGGAGRLMEIQGPRTCIDKFTREILRFNRGGIIITSLYERRPCFLTTPEWRDIAFDKSGLSYEDCLYTDVLQRMADFPALLRELKDLEQGNHNIMPTLDDILLQADLHVDLDDPSINLDAPLDFLSESFEPPLEFSLDPYPFDVSCANAFPPSQSSLINKLHCLKEELCALGTQLNARLLDGSAAIELPSIEEGSPIPTAFHFSGWRVTVAYNCFWALLILTNKLLLKLLPTYDPTKQMLEAECRTIAYEICKTWEDSWASKPIGAFHTGFSFVMAYEFCTQDVQEWILKGLNALLDCQRVASFRWSHENIMAMSGRLTGDGPDLKFTRSK